MFYLKIEGYILDVDYWELNGAISIRMTVKTKLYGTIAIYDPSFKPYFYVLPKDQSYYQEIISSKIIESGRQISPILHEDVEKSLKGTKKKFIKVYVDSPSYVPKLSSYLSKYGTCYESDIPFARRYSIDKNIIPLVMYSFEVEKTEKGFTLVSSERSDDIGQLELNTMYFDIETYNPLGFPRPEKDPIIMISYSYVSNGKIGNAVFTTKEINKEYVKTFPDEASMIKGFIEVINKLDIDVLSGYNSANFDMKYLIERSKVLGLDFNISRFEGETRIEKHGLVDKVKIGGRIHIDMYLVIKFISVVGAAESILKLNSYRLKDVYDAISEDEKLTVEKTKGQKWKDINELWNGTSEDLCLLADYNLSDSEALKKVYEYFIPIMIEMSRVSGNVLNDTSVSTTGQIVEYLLMRYAVAFNEIIPNKPTEYEIRSRLINPIEGAYVKTPDPGIYNNLAILDFRGLYPSIIIAHNIDPSSLCDNCTEYYESPSGYKFDKNRKSIIPTILQLMIEERKEVKKQYKKHPENIFLGSRSQALKITANSFYGYLGYARSRWYSRECASSVTAYGRQYIQETIRSAEEYGFKVIYGDTDSIVILLGNKSEAEVLKFMKDFNSKLPGAMELELEDFYTRAVFVGKKSEKLPSGAKKKYAMISKSGHIKIRGFELVRRDWSKIARDTQRGVLEIILKYGDAEKAANMVKDVIRKLRAGEVPISDLAIHTQLRKSMDNYDSNSPELAAARKALNSGLKTKDELEHAVISYVVTKKGSTISEKAELEEVARDYDAEYYINHQIIPATMRILKELDFKEAELTNIGNQKKL
ncbi:MAG: DNA-directed DNA polymerase [Candidatus Micrarchaeaceae archaeon]